MLVEIINFSKSENDFTVSIYDGIIGIIFNRIYMTEGFLETNVEGESGTFKVQYSSIPWLN